LQNNTLQKQITAVFIQYVQYTVNSREVFFENLSHVISENLKRVREEKRLSLDARAKLSGVSKSMLGQIERCEVNPTVSTMREIANELKVFFSQFVNHVETNIELIDIRSFEPLLEDEGRVKNLSNVFF